jgi:DNA repair protein RecO (recombination protein O)
LADRRRVDGQPSFVLHSYPYRETSLILDVFTRDYGRISLAARGARRPRSSLRGLLMSFQPLELGWTGSGEVMTLMKAEWQGGLPLLSDKALFVGYHFNELLMHLLPREDPHPRLFDAYYLALHRLSAGLDEAHIRVFEKALLQELGYGLMLDTDVSGLPLVSEAVYRYEPEHGPVLIEETREGNWCISGKTLLDLARDDYSDSVTVQQAKQLMRQLIQHHIGEQPLTTRRIFQDLQEL